MLLYDYVARYIPHQPPQPYKYAGNKEVGKWLYDILREGGSEDWRKVLKDATGVELSTRSMIENFQPLMAWPKEQNKGRKIGWAERAETDHEEKEREHGG